MEISPDITNLSEAVKRSMCLSGISESELNVWAEQIVCIVGPSAVGKHSLCHKIIKYRPKQYHLLGPTTTRLCTLDDIKCNKYISVTQAAFESMLMRKEFLYWRITSDGSYGIEKRRIRTATIERKKILLTFRSIGALAFKTIMPRVTVLEMRCPISVLLERIKARSRFRPDEWKSRIEVATEELHFNGLLYEKYSRSSEDQWFQIDNEEYEPPISKKTVESALSILDNIG